MKDITDRLSVEEIQEAITKGSDFTSELFIYQIQEAIEAGVYRAIRDMHEEGKIKFKIPKG